MRKKKIKSYFWGSNRRIKKIQLSFGRHSWETKWVTVVTFLFEFLSRSRTANACAAASEWFTRILMWNLFACCDLLSVSRRLHNMAENHNFFVEITSPFYAQVHIVSWRVQLELTFSVFTRRYTYLSTLQATTERYFFLIPYRSNSIFGKITKYKTDKRANREQ